MRIKSDFKDYYDGVMRMGMDTDLLWLRKSVTEKNKMVLYHEDMHLQIMKSRNL